MKAGAESGRLNTSSFKEVRDHADLQQTSYLRDAARVELIMDQGAKLNDPNIMVRDGYLSNWKTGKTVTLIVSDKFIMVIRL